MPRLMYDTIRQNAHRIPANAEIVAGYVNGIYTWTDAEWALFPNAERVEIVIHIPGHTPPNVGLVLDVEAGDAPTAREVAARWVAERRAAGIVPTIYTSTSALKYLGGLPADFWLARPGPAVLLPGTVATQYGYLGVFDVSIVADGWPRPTGEVPLPMPNAPGVAFVPTKTGHGYWLFGADGGVFNYGDAGFFGSHGGEPLNAPIVDAKVTETEQGYWLFGEDYGVFAYGDATYLGHP